MKKLGMVVHAIIPARSGSINRRIVVQTGLGKKQECISKITRAKRAGGMAQEGECLPSNRKSLSSKPLEAHACNPSYSEGRDQEVNGLKPALVDSSRDPISKILGTKKGCRSDSSSRPPA
jgi:hypothetical protein